jgi:hypothetical protein
VAKLVCQNDEFASSLENTTAFASLAKDSSTEGSGKFSRQKEHDEHLEKVLSAIEKAGVTLNEKSEFSKPSVKFLGQIIDSSGYRVDPDKVKARTRFCG